MQLPCNPPIIRTAYQRENYVIILDNRDDYEIFTIFVSVCRPIYVPAENKFG